MFVKVRYTSKLFITMLTGVGMQLGVLVVTFITLVFNLALKKIITSSFIQDTIIIYGGRGHRAVYYTSSQSFIITIYYSFD